MCVVCASQVALNFLASVITDPEQHVALPPLTEELLKPMKVMIHSYYTDQ